MLCFIYETNFLTMKTTQENDHNVQKLGYINLSNVGITALFLNQCQPRTKQSQPQIKLFINRKFFFDNVDNIKYLKMPREVESRSKITCVEAQQKELISLGELTGIQADPAIFR